MRKLSQLKLHWLTLSAYPSPVPWENWHYSVGVDLKHPFPTCLLILHSILMKHKSVHTVYDMLLLLCNKVNLKNHNQSILLSHEFKKVLLLLQTGAPAPRASDIEQGGEIRDMKGRIYSTLVYTLSFLAK